MLMRDQTKSSKNAAISSKAVQKATGKSWEEWFAVLNELKAAELSHPAIVGKLYSDYGVDEWWAQMITVEFERTIGRREAGQRCDGTYATSASKTLSSNMDTALECRQTLVCRAQDFNGVAFSAQPSINKTDKWRYWRVKLADGARINVNITQKEADKTLLSVQHEGLQNKEDIEHWKTFWKSYLSNL
jgi:hypothetical protein